MIPIDFDWKFYTSYYIDLNQFNEKKARCHYLNHGIHEGRLYKPVINNSSKIHTSFIEKHKIYIPYFFDWKFYKSLYSDCSSLDEKGVKFHYIKIGIEENRKYNNNILLPKNFDFLFYKHYYKDLGKMGYHSLVRHYLLHGIFERRICNRQILLSINKMILANKYKWITNNKLLLTHDSCIIPKEWNYLNIDDIRSTINNLLKDHINAANIIRDWYINIIVRSDITMAMGERDKRETVEEETRVRELFDLPYDVSSSVKSNIYNDIDMDEFSEFKINNSLKNYIITLLGYKKINEDGTRHTNWFPWNRFKDVYETIGYKCEWISLEELERKNEKRLFITWNEPTSIELYKSGKINKDDIVFQKLTSLGKGMNGVNWTENPKKWCEEWNWPIYRTVEYLYDLGLNIYAFGCKTDINLFSEKKRICEKLKDRIHWITWGGTPFNWEQIKNCKPKINNLNKDISFVGSKWGRIGRGNVDAWEKYIEPFESDNCKKKFNQYGGIGNKMVTDDEMVEILQESKLCPIIHAPSWQAERGIQDRFYTVFLSGRFGICDNLGAVDIFGDEIKDICTEDPEEYHKKSIYYIEHPEEQIKYIEMIQKKIKNEFNFYRQWESVFNNINCNDNFNFDLKFLNEDEYFNNLKEAFFGEHINKNIINYKKELHYNYNLYNYKNRSNKYKLKYKLNLFENQSLNIITIDCIYKLKILNDILIVNNQKYDLKNIDKKILLIYEINSYSNILFINDKFILNLDKIQNIDILKEEYFKCSINIPISLKNIDIETIVNFDFSIKKYIEMDYQINILHTDYMIDIFDDFVLEKDNLNYIYISNPYNFNLGYTRNLYKFLNLSNNVYIVDVDIFTNEEIINKMLEQTKIYDVIKPYDLKLVNVNIEEKYNYIINGKIPEKNSPDCLFSNTGGNTLFKRNVLEECGGYEEINRYGYEDRFLDVIILSKNYKIKRNNFDIFHLWHPHGNKKYDNITINSYNEKYYNCFYSKKNKIHLHEFCNHVKDLSFITELKKNKNYNLNLFIKNKNVNHITLKDLNSFDKKIVKLNLDKKYDIKNYYIFDNNENTLKQIISNKYIDNNLKLSFVNTKINIDNFIHKFEAIVLCGCTEFISYLEKKFKNQKNINNILNNKRVVIVGPADYVDSNDKINNYDVIVRVNKGLSQQGNGKCGNRTDILYHVVNQNQENGGPIDVNFNGHIRFTYPILDYDEETTFKDIGTIRDYFEIYKDNEIYNHIQKDFSIINKFKYLEMEKILQSRPNSGIATILDLLTFNIKELYITGFTLFQTNYAKDYRDKVDGIDVNTSKLAIDRMSKSGHHDQVKTALIFKNKILKDERVKYDEILKECVNKLIKECVNKLII